MKYASACLLLVLAIAWTAPVALSASRWVAPGPVAIAVSPSTLLKSADQCDVTVHTTIPLSVVVRPTVKLNGIPAKGTWADNRGCLVARFDEDAVKAIVAPPSALLTLTGERIDGTLFSGSDRVRVRK